MQGINSRWTKQCLRPTLQAEGELGNEDNWNGNSSGRSQWLLLEQMSTAWVCHCIPSLPWECSCSTGIKQIVGLDLLAYCLHWLVRKYQQNEKMSNNNELLVISAGLIAGGAIKSALGLRQQEQEEKSALHQPLEKAQSCLRGQKIFSVRWNYCLSILNACKYIFLWFIKEGMLWKKI